MTTYGTGQQHLSPEHEKQDRGNASQNLIWIRDVIERVDAHLDANTAREYRDQPLAGHWARVTKVCSEAGEVMDALSAWTGENPRKGVHGTRDELTAELADTACAALLAIQHLTKNSGETWGIFLDALAKAESRVTAVEALEGRQP